MLAWGLLPVLVVAGVTGSAGPARANIRIASSSSTSNSRTSSSRTSNSRTSSSSGGVTAAGTAGVTAVPAGRAPVVRGPVVRGPVVRYVVQPGDTLAGIAAGLGVRGGWPVLYAVNRAVIGPDPGVVRAGAVLVVPGQGPLVRYRVAGGDTLAGIAAGLGVRGGWPVLYAANRAVIGPDPGMIRPGMVLRVPGPAAPAPAVPAPAATAPVPPSPAATPGRPSPPPPAAGTGAAGRGHRPAPARGSGPAGAGMPRWLTTVLLAAGLLTGAAFLTEPVLMLRRRRRAARLRPAAPAPAPASGPVPAPGPVSAPVPVSGPLPGPGPVPVSAPVPGPGRLGGGSTRVVLADFDRVVVTHSGCDDTVYVLRPPGEDPEVILRAARLVLPEGPYGELADQLGVPAALPMR
jgi:LysM domain